MYFLVSYLAPPNSPLGYSQKDNLNNLILITTQLLFRLEGHVVPLNNVESKFWSSQVHQSYWNCERHTVLLGYFFQTLYIHATDFIGLQVKMIRDKLFF